MKTLVLAFVLSSLAAGSAVAQQQSAKQQQPVKQGPTNLPAKASKGASISFGKTGHAFGDITEGDVVQHTFDFKNTGTEPLVIERVHVTCDCTTPTWTKEPILPGESGVITVQFNSTGKPGQHKQAITILSNANDAAYVYLETNVKRKPTGNEKKKN